MATNFFWRIFEKIFNQNLSLPLHILIKIPLRVNIHNPYPPFPAELLSPTCPLLLLTDAYAPTDCKQFAEKNYSP